MNAAKLLKAVLLVAPTVFLLGCPTRHPHYLAQPEPLSVRGAYVHPASRITMPERVADFPRNTILRYDADGLDVSAGYNLVTTSHHIVATVYVYPAPSLVSVGSPAEVIAGARAHLTEGEFERRKQEIQHAHPGVALIEQRASVRTESGHSYSGKLAIFEYDDLFAGSRISVRSYLCLFCYVGDKWAVAYRFTYPKTEDADREIQEFIKKWIWYGTGI